MDNDNLTSRVERTFWTVWYYVTGAVNRLLRPEPTTIVRNDPNSLQKSAVDSGPGNCHTEDDARGTDVDEEQPLSTVSVISSSQLVVAWELCTTDINKGPEEENKPCKTQMNRGSQSKASTESEGMSDEHFLRPRNDDAGLLVVEDARRGKQDENCKLLTHGPDEMQDNDEYEEHVKTMSLLAVGAMSEDVEESRRKSGAEEETERAMTLDDHRKIDDTMAMIEIMEEDDKMHLEDKQELKAEDTEVKLHMAIDLGLEEEDNIHIDEANVQRDEADAAVMTVEVEESDGVLQLATEKEKKPEGATQVENQLLVCEQLPDEGRDFKGDPVFTSLHVDLQMADRKIVSVSDDEQIDVGKEHVIFRRSESHKAGDEKEDEMEEDNEKEDEMEEDNEKGDEMEEDNVNEAGNNQTTNGVPEKEDDKKLVQEQYISTGRVPRSKGFVQNSKSELDSVEFTIGEQEDMTDYIEMQTKTKETDNVETKSHGDVIALKSDVTTDISIDERFLVEDQVEEERLSSEVGDKDSDMELARTVSSLTVKPEGETQQEISGYFKNIPLGICEGQLAVSPELNSPTCEETQEGVPEYNNEPGPDENTTQRFLEVRDCEGIQTTQLPEESLQSSSCDIGADYLLVRKHMEEERESAEEDIQNRFDLVVKDHIGKLCHADAGSPQETETVFTEAEEEEGKLLVDSLKTGIKHTEKEFEMHVSLTDETDKTTKELKNKAEELLDEFGMDEGLCEVKEEGTAVEDCEMTGVIAAEEVVKSANETLKLIEAEVQEMRETSVFMESVEDIKSEQNNYRTLSLLDDITESGFLKQSVKTSNVEMQNARIDMEKTGHEGEREAAEDEVQNKNEIEILNLQVVVMADEPITEKNEKENTLIAESDSLEMQNQLSDKVLEISSEETQAPDDTITSESKPKDMPVISAEEMAKHVTQSEGPINECQDVIDEEILDLWLHAALSEDTDGIKQQKEPEPGQQMDTEIEPSYEEQDEISSVLKEEDQEQLVESNPGESELVSDTEMSSSMAESEFLDQSLCDCGAQSSETQLLESTSSGSFQGIHDMLANASEFTSVSELSTQQPNSGSQDILIQENTEAWQSYMKKEESSEDGHPNKESGQSQEKNYKETGSNEEIDVEIRDFTRKTEWKDDEGANAESLTEMDALFKSEETKVGDKPQEITMSDSSDEIEHTDSDRSGTGSESLLEEGIVTRESGSQKNTCNESENKLFKLSSLDKPQPLWSEGVVDSLLGLKTAEDERLTTESGLQMEVDISVLDLTVQRSRIAVKNPLVRPPKNPRALLHMPSMNPTPSSRLPVKIPAGGPLGGFGIGIKLPGLGTGFPSLKKTQQETETKPEEKSNTPKQDEAKIKPKFMPPRHPGFANPFMSELKTKLKKTTKHDES